MAFELATMSETMDAVLHAAEGGKGEGWLPHQGRGEGGHLEGTVADSPRKRAGSKWLFFLQLTAHDGSARHLLFKATSVGGALPDAKALVLKRDLRQGDVLSARYERVEPFTPRGAEAPAPLYHVADARITAMRVGSTREPLLVPQPLLAPQPLLVQQPARAAHPAAVEPMRAAGAGAEAEEADRGEEEANGGEAEVSAHAACESRAQKEQRFALFAQWLVATFKHVPLLVPPVSAIAHEVGPPSAEPQPAAAAGGCGDGSGALGGGRVLDVAGGRGDLCLELALRGWRCVVVDPRENCGLLSRKQRKRLRQGARPSDGAAAGFGRERCLFGTAATVDAHSALRTQQLLEGVGLLVGLHPDAATEAIVELAIERGLPWAVVPCCVFARLFPERRHRGRSVRTHAQLCEYLQARAAGARRTTLPFAGQNTVVYHLGDYGAGPRKAAPAECEPLGSALGAPPLLCVPCGAPAGS
jgi:hypothetical protein